jgi:hypothetical protein
MDRKRLADKIAADLLKTEPRKRSYPTCFTCGREFTPKPDVAGRFCSQRCIDLHDSGYTPQPNPDPFTTTWKVIAPVGGDPGYMPKPMRPGRHGFMINCANCGREFDCGSRSNSSHGDSSAPIKTGEKSA